MKEADGSKKVSIDTSHSPKKKKGDGGLGGVGKANRRTIELTLNNIELKSVQKLSTELRKWEHLTFIKEKLRGP